MLHRKDGVHSGEGIWYRKRGGVLVLILFWAVMFLICRPFGKDTGFQQEIKSYCSQEMTVLGNADQNTVIEQEFTGKYSNLKGIDFTSATSGRVNEGKLKVTLTDLDTGKLVCTEELDVAEMPDCNLVSVQFPEIPDSKGKHYQLSFSSDSKEDSCIILMGAESKTLEPAKVNNVLVEQPLRLSMKYHDTHYTWVRLLVWLLVCILSFVMLFLIDGANERSFLVLAITFGVLFACFTPFPYVLDESAHFFRSYLIANGNFVDDINENGQIGGEVSVNYDDTVCELLNIDRVLYDHDNWMARYSKEKEFFVNPYMSSYNPINHLPGAMGLKIAMLLHLPILYCILLGRLATLATFVTLAYLAIRKAKYYKRLFFMVAMVPMTMYLAGSFSADPLLISSAMLFTSICLKYRFEPDQTICRHELILMLLSVSVLSASKYLIYVPVLLLFFMIPKRCFRGRKEYLFELIAAVVIMAVFALSAIWLLKQFSYVEDRNGHVSVSEQIHFLLSNKLVGLGYLAKGFFDTLFRNLGCMNFQNIEIEVLRQFDIIAFAVMGFGTICEEKKYAFSNDRERYIFSAKMLFMVCIIYAMTVGALYLGFTPVGSNYVDGVQARYLLPVMPIFLIGLSGLCTVKHEIQRLDEKIAFFSILACLNGICGILLIAFA